LQWNGACFDLNPWKVEIQFLIDTKLNQTSCILELCDPSKSIAVISI